MGTFGHTRRIDYIAAPLEWTATGGIEWAGVHRSFDVSLKKDDHFPIGVKATAGTPVPTGVPMVAYRRCHQVHHDIVRCIGGGPGVGRA